LLFPDTGYRFEELDILGLLRPSNPLLILSDEEEDEEDDEGLMPTGGPSSEILN
jgi:hypothetical protein